MGLMNIVGQSMLADILNIDYCIVDLLSTVGQNMLVGN
jgi:hypothetical protein